MGAGWFLVALCIGETELLSMLPGPAVQVTLIGVTVGLLTAFWSSRSFRAFVNQLSLKSLIAVHLSRFIGIYFLLLYARGELPGRFALTAGWGDIAIALGALGLLLIPGALQSHRAVLAWNTLGLIDILLVITTASGLAFADRNSMHALTQLPLSFLPTLLVPLIISTHVVILLRLRRRNVRSAADGESTANQVELSF